MLRITDIKLNPREAQKKRDEKRLLKEKAAKILRISPEDFRSFAIASKSIDARKKNNVFFVYSLDVEVKGNKGYMKDGRKNKQVEKITPAVYLNVTPEHREKQKHGKRPVVIGSGPAGMFAALILAEEGFNPIILERGQDVDSRKVDVERFFDTGTLNPSSNVQFGEGGAGTFSDGKLNTGVRDLRIKKVIHELIAASAPKEIAYLRKPHIGTDILVRVVKNLREKITALGGEYRFGCQFTDYREESGKLTAVEYMDSSHGKTFVLETNWAVLATGHSARDTFELLHRRGLAMSGKSFAVGFRIEHPQEYINFLQYGKFAAFLPSADYKLAVKSSQGRAVYTFCMCPGGFVIPASSEEGRLCVNGMSNYQREGKNANSAIITAVSPADFGGGPLDGMFFQRTLEERAYALGKGNFAAPVQRVRDFLENRESQGLGVVEPTYPRYQLANLSQILGEELTEDLRSGIEEMDKKLKGFLLDDALLTGVEARSSSPITIHRDEEMHSSVKGLLPCGEGGGHAGGIMSAAVDGIRCAEAIIINSVYVNR